MSEKKTKKRENWEIVSSCYIHKWNIFNNTVTCLSKLFNQQSSSIHAKATNHYQWIMIYLYFYRNIIHMSIHYKYNFIKYSNVAAAYMNILAHVLKFAPIEIGKNINTNVPYLYEFNSIIDKTRISFSLTHKIIPLISTQKK